MGTLMRRAGTLPLIFGMAVGLLAAARAADAWHGRGHHPDAVMMPAWPPPPFAWFPPVLPIPGYRLFHPPGLPLSYQDPSSGATYCFSPNTGFYFVCGYARRVGEYGDLRAPSRSGGPPGGAEEAPPQSSGVLLFRLPADGEASVDGEVVGLSGGVGAAAVAPGRHRVRVRGGGQETDQIVVVASRAILTVTPGGISPADP